MRRALYVLVWLFATAPLAAHEPAAGYDRISLSVSAEAPVANDVLVAVLHVQREGQRHSAVADEVNRTMRWALEIAGRAATVQAQTLGYTTSPIYDKQVIAGWRARQQLRLQSREAAALTALIGELQERLAVGSIDYTVSAEARSAAEARIVTRALQAFRERAALVAGQLGRSGYRLVHVDVSTGAQMPPPMPLRATMRAEAADVAPPALAAGEQILSVTVSGTIELDPVQ